MKWLRRLIASYRQRELDQAALKAGADFLTFLAISENHGVPLRVSAKEEHCDLFAKGLGDRLQQFATTMRRAGHHG